MVRPALAAGRAIDILNFFAAHPGGTFTLSELSASLGINLASALSVLQALEDAGYLVRHPRRKTYELGPALVALGDAALRSNRAVDLARGEMRLLAEEFSTEAIISVSVGDDLVILAVEGRPQLTSADIRVGQRMPLVPPLGQVFFAWSAQEDVDAWLGRLDRRMQATARVHLPVTLAAVRERGYSITVESPTRTEIGATLERLADRPREAPRLRERLAELAAALGEEDYELVGVEPDATYDITTIVAPVFDAHGQVALALTLNGLRQVTGRQVTAHGDRLAATARLVTKQTGGRTPDPLYDL
ncbi:IclR family transcriptional regulator [Yinghuangia seranimata]|uniref:IclR family transcriptional regulator n=1 Tax=Yinghuangia seranimata TaxID=408067 RepID=UPI00248CF3FE|nr:helix-turn-helix domain-containing protein [Yinghuangia seranimata]MDI2127277.1 helix-turn-helix domain-containing protein [Yinghuangia seranimata]MDI2132222.1 helix-turn-helix domain-containing protein [Yinghuangia seranimata]